MKNILGTTEDLKRNNMDKQELILKIEKLLDLFNQVQEMEKERQSKFVYWLMDNCELIKDEETGENKLWRYKSEDYLVDGVFKIFVEEKLKNK